jgi:membrane anchored protein
MRRHMALAAIPACALIVFSPFSARAADVTVPAPPGAASAVALQVGSLLDISKTSAIAKDSPSTAEASVIRIGGQTILGLGGSQEGNGEKSGALIDTGASNPIHVEVAPWAAAVEEKADPTKTRRSKAEAALVRANVANVVKAAILHSKSEAEWTDLKSTGSAFSNGVELSVANAISVVLLHSEVRTDGQGNSYLVGLNGNQIGTDSQLGNSPLCALTLQSVLALSCLDASGGGGTTVPGEAREAAAEVARVESALEVIDPVAAFTTAGSSGGGAPAITLPAAPAPIPVPAAEQARTPDAIAPAATLPRTGAALAGFVVFGLVALLGGALLRLAGRRRVTA